jgi:hypothetical protein
MLPVRALILTLVVCGSSTARADALDDTFALSLGTFFLDTHTTVRADGSLVAGGAVVPGTAIDVERDLGIDNKTSFRLDGYWRFLERHKIRLMYFDENRSAARSLNKEIIFGGETYPINTEVEARLDTVVTALAYEYAFLRGEHYELSGSIGIHELYFKFKLTAIGQNINVEQTGTARLPS